MTIITNLLGCTPYQQLKSTVDRAEGAYLHLSDGRRIADLCNAFGTIFLGHQDPDIERAVAEGLNVGIPSGAANFLAEEVAQRIAAGFQRPVQVLFFMTGTVGTVAAAEIVRAATGRSLILSAGYHGWHPLWVAAPEPFTQNEYGVFDFFFIPELLERELQRHSGNVACMFVSPDYIHLAPDTLRALFTLARAYNVPIVIDDVKYGYRCRSGMSVQGLGLEADIYVVAKCLTNGQPLSAVVGGSQWLQHGSGFTSTQQFYPPLFHAARATLAKLHDQKVHAEVNRRIGDFLNGVAELAKAFDLPIVTVGSGAAFQFVVETEALATAFQEQALEHGIYLEVGDQQYPSFAFVRDAIPPALAALERVFAQLSKEFPRLIGQSVGDDTRMLAAWSQMDGLAQMNWSLEEKMNFVREHY